MPEDKSPFGTYLLIALVAVGAAAGGYYFKVYKPKHEYDDEDEMEEDEDESEDSESEKREVDDADEQEESTEPEILRDEDFDDNVLEALKKRQQQVNEISDYRKAIGCDGTGFVLGARTRKDGCVDGKRLYRFLVRVRTFWSDYAMHRNTMKNIKNGDMRICRLCRNVGNTRFWTAQKSSSES